MDASAEVEPPRGWRLKRALMQDPIASAAPLRTPLDTRPHTQVILRARTVDSAQRALLVLLGAIIGLFLVVGVTSRLWGLVTIASVLALLVAVAGWLFRQRAAMEWSATWYADSVVVRDGRYGPTRAWREPLWAFKGVRTARTYLPRGGALMPNLAVHGLMLVHPDPFKSVLLHAGREPIGDEVVRRYARQLGTSVID